AYFVCSMLQLFLEYPGAGRCTTLARLLCGGEPLSPSLVQRVRERLPWARLHNLYGPTESAVSATGPVTVEDDALGTVPIGRPSPNVRIYLLDEWGEPAPVRVAGEMYVGGAQLARGYLDRPGLTAERFVPDPFGGRPGARLYRTGDRARWRADGRIEFLGRMDFQVKVRGFRVEPGEVEERLKEHAGVRDAAVLAREDTPGEMRLVAYWLGGPVEAEALRAHLGEMLPAYMVPSAFVRLEQWPLTPTGKLDRKALPAPEGGAYASAGYEAPAGQTEEALAAIWSELLGVERVGRHDNFFDLGGHSLRAIRLVLRVKEEMQVDLALREVFELPVLSSMADHLLDAQLARFDPEELAQLARAMSEYSEG
ncbi:MAG TPA: non-ribosomal peptide synthetase, partial [Longimicrobium sp.]|nr:non-ribosomal peptide synthetase [Longimicrobium sp.]